LAQTGYFGMKRNRLLLLLAVSALLIESIAAFGWWKVQEINRLLHHDPGAAAGMIAHSPFFTLPAAAVRSRRLDIALLAGAPRDHVEEALERLSRVQRQSLPADPRGWLNAARLEFLRDRLGEGLEYLDEAIRRDPTNPFALRLEALALRAQGRSEESLKLLARAEAFAPGFRQPPVELTPEDERAVLLEGARLRLAAYPRLRIENTLRLEKLLRSLGKNEEARQLLDSLKGDPRADLLRARLALADGKLSEAESLAREIGAQSRLPSRIRAQAMALLAEILAEKHDMPGAVAAAGQARHLAPEISDPYRALARISERRGDDQDALEQLRRAWGMAPTDVGILYDLARVAEKVGQVADAKLALERVVRLRPEDADAVRRLVDFLLRNGEYMDAAMALSEGLDRHPADAALLQRAEKLHREVVGGSSRH